MIRNYIAIIWPTGYRYKEEIHEHYKADVGVNCVSDMQMKKFDCEQDFKDFIFGIYEQDDLSRDILVYKTDLMLRSENLWCIIFSFKCDSVVSDKYTDETVLQMKTDVRKQIAAKMKDYYYDILFHVTDTKAEFEYVSSFLLNYDINVSSLFNSTETAGIRMW